MERERDWRDRDREMLKEQKTLVLITLGFGIALDGEVGLGGGRTAINGEIENAGFSLFSVMNLNFVAIFGGVPALADDHEGLEPSLLVGFGLRLHGHDLHHRFLQDWSE
ncbi:hypothetical protein Scep_014160 [Stephania cephalantha]|uniref:Uncharacterized protein n=1 Tax=Stephania cephalantha TaxID=152367 RepID=A0AAP0J0R3_9MAGN